jgi:signal peptidase II
MSKGKSSTVRGMLPWLSLALLLTLLDQLTKVLILGAFEHGQATPMTSFFNLVRVHNSGAAFSFLAGASGWQRWFFTALGIGAAIFIVWLLRSHSSQRLFAFSMACLLGGAVGNVVDRVLYGYVVDFVQLHYAGWAFPAFNVADSAITAGAIGMILDELLRVRRGR